jgi:hypothetical protein
MVEDDSDHDCEDFDELLNVSKVHTLPFSWTLKAYIGECDAKNQSENYITSNVLVLDSEPLCLQGANGDGQSKNKVEEDQRRIGVADGLEDSPKLQ